MKILFVSDLYPIGNEDIPKTLYCFVHEWHKNGHCVDVIRPNFMLNTIIRGHKIIKEKVYNEQGINIYNLNFVTPFMFNVWSKLPKDFTLKNYDIMISHMPSGALMAQRLLEREKIRYICSVHTSDITVLTDIKYSLYFKNKLKQAYKSADKISARSPILQQKIEQIIPELQDKIFVAYSGIDFPIQTQPDKYKFNYKTLQICTVSKLIKRKNIDIIIKGLSELKYEFVLTVIGEGKEKKHLMHLAEQLGIRTKVKFLGKLSQENVLRNMQKNDIFILLSRNETFGMVYLEAMSMGNIVIANKNDGISGILKDEQNSFLINANSKELIRCIDKIYNLKETNINKIRNNAVETVKNMTITKAATHYIQNIC